MEPLRICKPLLTYCELQIQTLKISTHILSLLLQKMLSIHRETCYRLLLNLVGRGTVTHIVHFQYHQLFYTQKHPSGRFYKLYVGKIKNNADQKHIYMCPKFLLVEVDVVYNNYTRA